MSGIRTIAAALPRRPELAPGALRTVGFAVALLTVEALLAASLVDARFSRFLLLFLGAVAAMAIFRFPLAFGLVMLAMTDFIFYSGFVVLPLGPIEVRPFELVLAGLIAVAVLQPKKRTWGGPAGAALAIFLVLVGISGALAVTSGRATPTDALNWGRPLVFFTFFYVIVRLFPTSDQRRALLIGATVIAAITGFVALAVSLGWSFGDTLKGAGDQIIREEEGIGGIQRVRLPGLSLGYAVFWYAAVQVAASRGWMRWGWVVAIAGIAIDVAVSFNRNMWLGLLAGLGLMVIAGGPLLRNRLVAAVAAAVAIFSLVTLVGGSDEDRVIAPVVQRASTILNPSEVSKESSLQDRELETRVAIQVAKANLLIGVGAGAPFGLVTADQVGPGDFVRVPQLFLHNQYLYLVLIGGVGGLFTFVAFLGIPLVRAFRRTPRDPAIVACGVGIAMIMMSAVVAIYFTSDDMIMALAMLAAVIVADGEERAGKGLDSGLT